MGTPSNTASECLGTYLPLNYFKHWMVGYGTGYDWLILLLQENFISISMF